MKRILMSAFALIISVGAQNAFASGYEKAVLWSGKHAGLGGAATSFVAGAQGLYFNPAGLTFEGEQTNELSVQLSPTWVTWEYTPAGGSTDSADNMMSLVPAVLYARKINEQVTVGAGFYGAGGALIEYDDSGFEQDFTISEAAVGASYKIDEQWSVGLALRYVMYSQELKLTRDYGVPLGTQYTETELTDSDLGFRVGVQFQPMEFLGFGLSYRSAVAIDEDTDVELPDVGVSQKSDTDNQMPQEISFGVHFDASEMITLYFQYDIRSYGDIEDFEWDNANIYRLAAEFRQLGMPIRIGYVYDSGTSTDEDASPLATPPGSASHFTFGTGTQISESIAFNGALDYFTHTGEDENDTEYELSGYGIHLGVEYAF